MVFKKVIFYRQLSKMQIDISRQKVSRHFNLAFLVFSISADRQGLLAPEKSSSKMENQFLCS